MKCIQCGEQIEDFEQDDGTIVLASELIEAVEADEDIAELRELIERHQEYTDSTVAADVLSRWDETLTQFVKVMPTDYKRVLLEQKRKESGKA